jgi:nitrite reductase/ring-hydroxylating ferredoxin subunit/DMSO/TMAO reductase YedYZ heme-binding membrane subunit
MLHIILVIGPLARLKTSFLPILYNRRHLGVSMFIAAFIHGGFSMFQFHALGDVNPIYSLFTSNMEYGSLTNFPFQVLGFFALLILFVMASTSHDFFLGNLSAKVWKRLHMMVYVAYALIIAHVFLGAFQQETSPFTIGILVTGFILVASLHLLTAFKERKIDNAKTYKKEGWLEVCTISEIEEDRAKIFTVNNERVAIFKYDGKLSAIHNVCKHQGGPLGEGKIIDGCITCPWHGYQYLPSNGQSPPPFTEKVATYELKLDGEIVYIHPQAFEEGTEVKPCKI